ncbi:MAG: TlpA disulfide reductase family protein [Dongiaceae bacterium]
MAKRWVLAVLVAVLAAAAGWLAVGLIDAGSGSARRGTADNLANPPLDGTMADFTPASPARPAPAALFSDGDGRGVSLGDFAGKLVLLNFWATWCGPCIEEMPSLDRLQALAGDDRFAVLALSLDRKGLTAVRSFYDKLAIEHLGVYLDQSGEAARAFKVEGLPTSFLIGPDGAVLGAIQGPAAWDSAEALALIGFYRDRLFSAP